MRHLSRLLLWTILLSGKAFPVEISPPSPVPIHRLVIVHHDPEANVFVLAVRNGQFVDVDHFTTPAATIFTGPPGSYAVMVIEKGQQSLQVIVIGDDGPSPPPDSGLPRDLANAYGVGKIAYLEAKRINNPEATRRLAKVYLEQATALHRQTATPTTALTNVGNIRNSLGAAWENWAAAINEKMKLIYQEKGTAIWVFKDMFWEIGAALSQAAGDPKPPIISAILPRVRSMEVAVPYLCPT